MNIDATPLGELARLLPGSTTVLHRFGLRPETEGALTVSDAGRLHGVEPDELRSALEDLEVKVRNFDPVRSAGALVELIVARFHEPLRRDMPNLIMLADRVEKLHGDHERCPKGLTLVLSALWADLSEHMAVEERVIFPLIVARDARLAEAPLRRMREEHRIHLSQLEALAAITDSFTPPDDACRSWRKLYESLARFRVELEDHVRLEDDVLFQAFA
ncbi:hemerythrin domain-containing protein [Prosthecomicrobium sp. N25]|uniref:hemerythrin domain-containing protein n=1 Tax=Prosthecomicrobium sp. N25 TaxID=3129254 RepID=UPI00307795FF